MNPDTLRPLAVVAGASPGIGLELARLAARGPRPRRLAFARAPRAGGAARYGPCRRLPRR